MTDSIVCGVWCGVYTKFAHRGDPFSPSPSQLGHGLYPFYITCSGLYYRMPILIQIEISHHVHRAGIYRMVVIVHWLKVLNGAKLEVLLLHPRVLQPSL